MRPPEQECSEHCVLDTLKASQIETDVRARRELQKSSREPTIAAASV